MRFAHLTDWAEDRVSRMGKRARILEALVAALWGMIGVPIIWVIVMPLFGSNGPDAVLYGLAAALVFSTIGYALTRRLVRRGYR